MRRWWEKEDWQKYSPHIECPISINVFILQFSGVSDFAYSKHLIEGDKVCFRNTATCFFRNKVESSIILLDVTWANHFESHTSIRSFVFQYHWITRLFWPGLYHSKDKLNSVVKRIDLWKKIKDINAFTVTTRKGI